MTVVHTHRNASIDEIAAEMDRRGKVIETLEAERNLFKGKYRALLKLVSKTCAQLVHVTDHIQDEGDRRYFGSTNDADALRDLYDQMDSWVWDALDKHNQMKSDPYADIRKQRARAEKAEAAAASLREALTDIIAPQECGCSPVCQCNTADGLSIHLDVIRDIAREAIAKAEVRS